MGTRGYKMANSVLIAHYRNDIVSGAERAILDMVIPLNSRFSCTMLVPGEGSLSAFYQEKGCNVWVQAISTPRRKYPGYHLVQSIWMSQQLKKRQVKAIVCNTFSAASRISTASRLAKIPYAIFAREYVRDIPLYRHVLQQADLLLAVSADLAAHIQILAADKEVHVVHDNILSEPIFARLMDQQQKSERESPFGKDNPVIGWVGRITIYKQPDLFIRAMKAVLVKFPTVQFAIIGSSKENEREFENSLHQLANELGVSDHLMFLGQRDDVLELMKEFSVLCLTSTREPFARVLLEAQLVGCPVIAPSSGGAPEVIHDGSNGLLFDALAQDASDQLSERIIKLLEDRKLTKMFISQGYKDIMGGYASLQPVQVFEQMLDSMVRNGSVQHACE